ERSSFNALAPALRFLHGGARNLSGRPAFDLRRVCGRGTIVREQTADTAAPGSSRDRFRVPPSSRGAVPAQHRASHQPVEVVPDSLDLGFVGSSGGTHTLDLVVLAARSC